jgi:Histidine kinase-, DNA gyrase B-, and HSP90-like ATPase
MNPPDPTTHLINESLVNPPDPARMIVGLRDTGYSFEAAVADIVDNSVAAGATDVQIQWSVTRDGRKFIYFADNGAGMTRDELEAGMRYGSPKRVSAKSLGKFGLGMKTASSSCCRQLTVISRKSPHQPLAKLAWDIDHVENIGVWEMLEPPVTPDEEETFEEMVGSNGTLVVWSKCDRVLRSDLEPGSAKEQAALKSRMKKLSEHLGKVFHRFIDSGLKDVPNVSIRINGEHVEAWDPFYMEKSDCLDDRSVPVINDLGEEIPVRFRAFILPHQAGLNDEEKKKAKIQNSRQGFYVYRENRLIHDGDWFGLYKLEPHLSLLRAEFSFDHRLDEAFQVDVKKSRVIPDPALEEWIGKFIEPLRREANKRYRDATSKQMTGAAGNPHRGTNVSIQKAEESTNGPSIQSADPKSGEVTLVNKSGEVSFKIKVQEQVPTEELYIQPTDTVQDGNLWQPVVRKDSTGKSHVGIELNRQHDFYRKIYLPLANSNPATVQGIDCLLWALSNSEMNVTRDNLKALFEDLRFEVSRNLRRLIEDLPEPDSSTDDTSSASQ